MAKRGTRYVPPVVPSTINVTPWGADATMYRVHETIYAVDQFNPSPKGNARFSPIHDPSGSVIPTLYAATTPRGALMESVFRDVPYRAGFKNVALKRLEGRVCSTLLFQKDFQLFDLSKVALRGIGIQPRQLIDTTKEHYPVTRRWAEQVYAAHPPSRVSWSSRQACGSQKALSFFRSSKSKEKVRENSREELRHCGCDCSVDSDRACSGFAPSATRAEGRRQTVEGPVGQLERYRPQADRNGGRLSRREIRFQTDCLGVAPIN
jgi:hypothetical protein